MKKILIIVLLVLGFLLLFSPTTFAQNRAECDACGYCIGRTAPDNWRSCQACLYPDASEDPGSNQTLELRRNTTTGKMESVYKAPGTYYTQLGCLNIGADSFSNPAAAGGVLNFLLTSLIFPIVGVLSFISLIYGAFLLMTAQGSPEQISRGKSYIVGAIVGLIFTLSAILIINILAGDILRIPGFTRNPQAEVVVRGSVARVNGNTVYPILGVTYNGQEIESRNLAEGNQSVNINVPVSSKDLSNPEVLSSIAISMKNDECYSRSSTDRALCCDCAQDESAIQPQYRESWKTKCSQRSLSPTKLARCKDTTNNNGDVNMYISQISINGKKCLSYAKNGVPINPIIGVSSSGSSVYCTAIEN